MKTDRYVAALEISSSKITGAVGLTREGGQLDVLAVETERTEESVRYGLIQNPEEAAMRIRRVIEKLQRKPEVAPRRISGVYVGLSGRSLHSVTSEQSMHLAEETEISDSILDRLRDKALGSMVDSQLEVIDAVPRSFKIGKTETLQPKGLIGHDIAATYDIIVSRPELRRNITRTLSEKLGIRNEGFVVTAMATGHLLLSNDEKRLGCILVDFGAETTTISIYKYGHLQFFNTLPLGGRNITRDLTSLSLLEERAEDIKKTSGNALAGEATSSVNVNGLRLSDVNNIVVARAEEIVANIIATIEYAGLEEKDLPGGFVCIGRASKLNGLLELLANKSDLPVRRAQLPPFIRMEEMRHPIDEMLQLACILYEGASTGEAECLEMPARESLPANGEPIEPDDVPTHDEDTPRDERQRQRSRQRSNGFLGRIKRGISEYFKPDDDGDSEIE